MPKSPEGYQPSKEEMEKAEENMSWYQKMQSNIREERMTNPSEAQRKLYSWEYDDGTKFELRERDRTELLGAMREAGKSDKYKLELRVSPQIREFIEGILWGQDSYRLQSLLAEAFEGDADQHNISQITGGREGYSFVVYNIKNKKPEDKDR